MAHLDGDQKSKYVADLFGRIAKRYDLLNTVMTGGRHYSWRAKASDMACDTNLSGHVLDVASGTGDFALTLITKPNVDSVVCLDYTPNMLHEAVQKARNKDKAGKVSFVLGDAHTLPLPDELFISVTVGFGVRNFVHISTALSEMYRVLKSGGKLVILEIVRLENETMFKRIIEKYFRYVTPWIGTVLAGDREAYTYLPQSVENFLSVGELCIAMENAGFRNVMFKTTALGTVATVVGTRV